MSKKDQIKYRTCPNCKHYQSVFTLHGRDVMQECKSCNSHVRFSWGKNGEDFVDTNRGVVKWFDREGNEVL